MRRKQGELTKTELSILKAVMDLKIEGKSQAYGFSIASNIAGSDWKKLLGFGTLYRALYNLEKLGYLQSHWEILPEAEKRPRRRFYEFAVSDNVIQELLEKVKK